MPEHREYGWLARLLDNRTLVMVGVLVAAAGCEAGAWFLWDYSKLLAGALGALGLILFLIVWRGKVV